MKRLFLSVLTSLAGFALQAGPLLPLEDRGDTTYDPNTRLEWLDLKFTAGHSYQTILNGWDNYTTSQGYRFASRDEVNTLFAHAGAPELNSGWSVADAPAARSLLSLMGSTLSLTDLDRGWMFYDPSTEPTLPSLAYSPSAVFGVWRAPGGDQGVFLTPGITSSSDYSSPEMASALVRVVPEPASWLLFVFAAPFILRRTRQPGRS